MLTGPEIRSGELCALSSASFSSGGNWKSAAIAGKSRLRSAGRSDGFSADNDRK